MPAHPPAPRGGENAEAAACPDTRSEQQACIVFIQKENISDDKPYTEGDLSAVSVRRDPLGTVAMGSPEAGTGPPAMGQSRSLATTCLTI